MTMGWNDDQHLYDSVAKHVSEEELADCRNPEVGDGTPDTAPEVEYHDPDWVQVEGTPMPTRKWIAARITAFTGWFIALIENGWEFNSTLSIALVTIVSEATISWIITNDPSPGGVPERDGEAGHTLVELAFALLVLVIAAAVLLAVLD